MPCERLTAPLTCQGLHDRNETLFHRVLIDEIDMIAPLVYTPTVGRVCQEFSQRYTRCIQPPPKTIRRPKQYAAMPDGTRVQAAGSTEM